MFGILLIMTPILMSCNYTCSNDLSELSLFHRDFDILLLLLLLLLLLFIQFIEKY